MMTIRRSRLTALMWVVGLAVSSAGGVRAAETFFDVDATGGHDSNVSHSEFENEVRDDAFVRLRGAVSRLITTGEMSGVVLRARGNLTGFSRYDGLNHGTVALEGKYEFQARLAFGAPRYTLFGDVDFAKFNSDIRSGITYRLGASVTRLLSDRIRVGAKYNFEDRHANGTAFDTTNHVFRGSFDYHLTDSAVFYGNYTARVGEAVWVDRPWPKLMAASKAADPDPTFGPRRAAWRLDATSHVFGLGLNFALGRKQSLDLLVQPYFTNGDGGNRYDGRVISGAYLLRF